MSSKTSNNNLDDFSDELPDEFDQHMVEHIEMSGDALDRYITETADTVRIGLDQSIAILTPWFFNNMPKIYYAATPRAEKIRHLSAIITGHVFETKQTVELWDRDRAKVTYIGPGGDQNILLEMAGKIKQTPLKMGALYFSKDKLLFLSTFFCNQHVTLDTKNIRIMEKIKYAQSQLLTQYPKEKEQIDHYIDNLDNDFVIYATTSRILRTYNLMREIVLHEGAHTIVEPIEGTPFARLSLGIKNLPPGEVLEQVLYLKNRYSFNLIRAFTAQISKGYPEPISIFHFIIRHAKGEKITLENLSLIKLIKALRTLSWVDNDEYSQLLNEPHKISINGVNFFRSMATWIQVLRGKENPYYFSEYKIRTTLNDEFDLSYQLLELFRVKFDPLKEEERKNGQYGVLKEKIVAKVKSFLDEVQRSIFMECLSFVDHTLKTNYFFSSKTGLAFRLDPGVLDKNYYPQAPFGVFFIVGRDYRLFHVRWKDISRGGLRVVLPKSKSDYEYALAGLFDEVYGLSNAQQLKNKDIPEGGSKAVLLIKPGGMKDQSVKGAVNALLDLLVTEDEYHQENKSQTIQYYDKDEIIYLGPDENVTNDLIKWIPEQAARRGYRYARAFMSSKPEDGINHKQYGVTSEGISVFINNMLSYLNINPLKEKFTIRMTGGPDGDVGGNLLKVMHREFKENAQILTISDGLGAAYDPKGLNWQELLRLFNEGKSIVHFDKKLLSGSDAFVLPADTPEHINIRNSIFAKVKGDLFIPAGGRPYTINDKNWNMFLDESGKPNVKGIIEGANIFFTAGAREQLQNSGVLMLKDSSANKTGVICSSYEIIASLILEKEEFIAIKDDYVKEVIDILRQRADLEARLLFAEYNHQAGKRNLVNLSMDISMEINEITDLVLSRLSLNPGQYLKDNLFMDIIYEHCPTILLKKYKERILSRLPIPHQIAIISARVASMLVYYEGLGWIRQMPEGDRFNAILTYLKQNKLSNDLIKSVGESSLTNKDLIAAILKRSAARDLTIMSLEKQR